jgi:hypothetical protein
MTKFNSADIGYLLLGPYNINNVVDALTAKTSDPVVETTPFGVRAAEFGKPGVQKHELSGISGWYDSDAASVQGAMVGLAAGEHVFMMADKGNVAGLTALCAGGALKAGFERVHSVGDFTKSNLELGVSGVMDDAVIVAPLAQVSGDGNTETAHLDLGAAGGGHTGGNAYMSCTQLSLTGSTNLIITLEDSADHAAWADHDVFTALTAVGAQRIVSTDLTVNRYLAYKRAFTGIAGTPTATFTIAYKVNDPH